MKMLVVVVMVMFGFGTCDAATTAPTTTLAPCSAGTYRSGTSCVKCSGNCNDGANCNINTGQCTACKPGFDHGRDPKCTLRCDGNKYGQDCSQTCMCASDTQCDRTNGVCSGACVAGRWGDTCLNRCSGNCQDPQSCEKSNGQCSCRPGYQPPTCVSLCDGNKYGQDCSQTCMCASDTQCNRTNGVCAGACVAGRWGDACQYRCSPYCQDPQSCEKSNGHCPCRPGYRPPTCVSPCSRGYYGQNCQKACGFCQKARYSPKLAECNHVTGHCSRCEDNRQMPLCTECKAGYWGPRCLQLCGHCGGEGKCNSDTGDCEVPTCKDGWRLASCTEKCGEGWYGQNCSKQCGRCRDNSACRHDNGVCEMDCEDGYEGVLCQEEKQNLVGAIVGSLLGAAIIIAIAIVVVGVLRYVKRKKQDGSYNDGFNTLADIHSVRRNNTSTRTSQNYQNVDNPAHNNPAFNSDYDRVHQHNDAHAYDSHHFPSAAAQVASSQSEPVYQNADATSGKPRVALKPPNAKKKGKKSLPDNTYGNVEFGAKTDTTYGNMS